MLVALAISHLLMPTALTLHCALLFDELIEIHQIQVINNGEKREGEGE